MTANDEMDFEGQSIEIDSNTVTVGREIGRGNEGRVFRIENQPEHVVKIFEPDRRGAKQPKIEAMLDNAPTDPTADQKGIRSIVWPTAVGRTAGDGSFLGYRMPYQDLDDSMEAFEYTNRELNWSDSDPEDRYKIARNLAIVVQNVHSAGHAIGDFNDKNILIHDGYVTLIDTDAFTIRTDDTVFADTSYHPRYSPPEKRKKSLTAVQRADQFCLAVHIFQFLMEGFHPFQAGDGGVGGDWPEMIRGNPFPYVDTNPDIEPHESLEEKYERLPDPVQNRFAECFSEGSKSQPWGRPTPKDWIRTIGNLSEYSLDVNFGSGGGSATDNDDLDLPTFGSSGGGAGPDENDGNDDLDFPEFAE